METNNLNSTPENYEQKNIYSFKEFFLFLVPGEGELKQYYLQLVAF